MIKQYSFFIIALFSAILCTAQNKQQTPTTKQALYFPAYNNWEKKLPQAFGISASKLEEAISVAKSFESKNPRSMEENHYRTFGKEPFGEAVGVLEDRGDQTGIIIYQGYKIAEWGTPNKCDMTHSVTKSFLSAVVGVAVDRGLINSVNDLVANYVPPIEVYNPSMVNKPAEQFGVPELMHPFQSVHNQTITWESMLRQTSDWEGTLWGKPDWADRPDANPTNWLTRKRNAPGAVYEYNDVRVNALALAATSVWRKPLPQVLKEYIMDPIGASNTWRWTGYRNAWIVVDGQPVQSVSGGGHWGGGMLLHAEDMARFGLLTLRNGNWKGQQLLSAQWVKQSLTPTSVKKDYGYMNWFLNTNKEFLPSAPESAFVHVGNGNNIIYVDRENDLVVVLRWIEPKGMDAAIAKIIAALKG